MHETFDNLAVFISSGGQLQVEEQNPTLHVPRFQGQQYRGVPTLILLHTNFACLAVGKREVWALRVINLLKYPFTTFGKGWPALFHLTAAVVLSHGEQLSVCLQGRAHSTGTGEGCRTSCYFAVVGNGD